MTETDLPSLPVRPIDGHKGTFGTVIIVGGSTGMIGAPALSARSAFRMGAGLVKILAPAEALHSILSLEPSATGMIMPDDPGEALHAIQRADPEQQAILAIGPGLGMSRHTQELVEALLSGQPRTTVLDADGLNALASLCARSCLQAGALPRQIVLTPHPGEYGRLAHALHLPSHSATEPQQRPDAAKALAETLRATVVLKGHQTVTSATDGRTSLNQTGNVAMAAGGSGDVLTGVIASLLAQGMTPYDAARLGTHLHGLSADLWVSEHADRGLLARELSDGLLHAIKHYAS